MSTRVGITLAGVCVGLALTGCGSKPQMEGSAKPIKESGFSVRMPASGRCPQGVLVEESRGTPIREALRAAEKLLARTRVSVQGTTYYLTPRHAPIDFITPLSLFGSRVVDEQVAGKIALHRAAARLCGEATAQASWAIRYFPVTLIAGLAGHPFLVKTRTGWRFWGNGWCGAGHSRAWRTRHCL
jgi:hypothetical protein